MPGYVYAYDTANRLTQATGGGYVIGYSYDGDGLRTHSGTSVVGGGAVYDVSYVADVGGGLPTVLEERRSGVNVPTETRKYVWGAGGLAYVASSLGTVDIYHSDGLGSVRALSDSTAQVVETYQTRRVRGSDRHRGLAPPAVPVHRGGAGREWTHVPASAVLQPPDRSLHEPRPSAEERAGHHRLEPLRLCRQQSDQRR